MKTKFIHAVCCLFGLLILATSCSKKSDPIPEVEIDKPTINTSLTVTLNEKSSGLKEADRLEQSFPASDFTPVGIYLAPNQNVVIKITQLAGNNTPELLVGTYSRYKEKWNPTAHPLTIGTNNIRDSSGGLIYFRYISENSLDSQVEVTIEGGNKIPYYVKGETTQAEWIEMLDEYVYSNVQLVSDRAIIVVSKEKALAYKDASQDDLLNLVDLVIDTEDDISGLDGSSMLHQTNAHKYLMTESNDTDFWMAATWYRTFYQPDATKFIINPNELKNDGWGPWHELGHMHQQTNWTWNEVGEVTVNIYSLAVERKLGFTTTRLERENVWGKIKTYMATPIDERDYNSNQLGPFERLALFQQLWLEFGDEFFIKLHQVTREEDKDIEGTINKMNYLMLKASEVSEHNLKNFFIEWGFNPSQDQQDLLDALGLPEPTTDITSLTD